MPGRSTLTNVTVIPKSGRVASQESILLKFECQASIPFEEKGFFARQQTPDLITTSSFIKVAYGRLDPQLLDFGMVCLNTSSSKMLKVENYQNRRALVKIRSDDSQVEIKGETSREIPPRGSHDFEVSLSPKSPGVIHGTPIHLEGVTTQVTVLLRIPPPILISTSKRIKLGEVPYGLEIMRTFELRNVGSGPAFVEFHTSSVVDEVNLEASPSQVEIRSQESVTFKVTCLSRKTGLFEIPISIRHANKEMMKITAQGICVFPKIEVHPSHLRLTYVCGGTKALGTPTGETAKDSFAVKNVSSVPARIDFALDDYRDFSVEDESPGLLKPFMSKNYKLIFKPEKVSNVGFMLPLLVNGERIRPVTCRVTATSICALANVLPRVIYVQYPPFISKLPGVIQKAFQIESCTNQEVRWRIDKKNIPPNILIKCDDDTLCGTLRADKSPVNFRITLTPAFQLNSGSQDLSGQRLMAYQEELSSNTSRVVERWLCRYGFPGGVRKLNFPIDFQRCLSLHHIRLQEQHQKNDQVIHNLDILIECLTHMTGLWSLHGVPRSLTLPISDTATCIGALYNHHAALICFAESQGGFVGHIAPEHLMTYIDYLDWIRNGRPCGCDDLFNVDIPDRPALDGVATTPTVILSNPDGKECLPYPRPPILDKEVFERASQIAWTDLFLQLLKTLEVGEGTEAKLLKWINEYATLGWTHLCEANTQPNISSSIYLPCPKVRNFHKDLANGLALAAVIASQAPFVNVEVLSKINLDPKSPQLQFHNAIQVVKALEFMRLDVDLTPDDIVNPNVIHMTLVLTRLYRLLPEYEIKSTISFAGNLRTRVLKDLKLTNPTNQTLRYQCSFVGKKANYFRFKGRINDIQVTELELEPNRTSILTLTFTVSSLQQSEAHLLLVAQRAYIPRGATMVFRLIGEATGMKSEEVYDFKTTCYQAMVGAIPIRSPFNATGHFKLRLMESPPTCLDMPQGCLRGFTCRLSEIVLHSQRATNVEVAFHPFSVGKYKGQLVFSSDDLGDFTVELRGNSEVPMTISPVNEGMPYMRGSQRHYFNLLTNPAILKSTRCISGLDEVFKFCCPVGTEHHVIVQLPSENLARYSAMQWVVGYCLPPYEVERIKISGSFCGAVSKLLRFKDLDPSGAKMTCFQIKCDSPIVKFPQSLDVDLEQIERSSRYVDLPLCIFCPKTGNYHINVVLSGEDDLRRFMIECIASEDTTIDNSALVLNAERAVDEERFTADPTVFVTEDFEKLQRLSDQEGLGVCLYAGRVEIKCQVGDCTHKTSQFGKHDLLIFLPKNKFSRAQSFLTESDFPTDIFASDTRVISKPNYRGRCRITIPLKRRAYIFGRLLFKEDLVDSRLIKKYCWDLRQAKELQMRLLYEVDICIKPAPPIQRLEVICHCLEVNKIVIPLNFSTQLPGVGQHLQVNLEGSNLTGPNFTEDASIYTAEYRPTCRGKAKASIIFYDSNLGEFWVDLTLVTESPLPQLASPWRCELGRKYLGVVEIGNPSRKSYNLAIEVANDEVYVIESYSLQEGGEVIPLHGTNVPLPASSNLYLNVTFQPQEYGRYLNDGEITLKSDELGELRIQLRGEGCLPTRGSEVAVTSEVGKTQLFNVPFANPFPYPIVIHCALEAVDSVFDGEKGKAFDAFDIRGERCASLLGKQKMEFHLAFLPSSMHLYKARFKINARKANPQDGGRWESEEAVAWVKLLRGTPTLRGKLELSLNDLRHELLNPREQPKSNQPSLLKEKAGTSTSIKLHFNLAGFVQSPDEDLLFNWKFLVDSCHGDALVDADAVIKKAIILDQTNCGFINPSDNVPHLELAGAFRPTRSFKAPAKFKALFAKSGAGLFSINKTSGLLPAKGSGFFNLVVKCTRKSYGKKTDERLIIQVDTFIVNICLEGKIELRLSAQNLSSQMEVFVYIYVGHINSTHHRQLWRKWIDDGVLTLGTEKINPTIIVSGNDGSGPYNQLVRVPFDHAGSPTAVTNLISNFYEVSKNRLTIRDGFCGEYRVYGVSATVNQTFDVYIKNCSCKFHEEEHVGKMVSIQDYCDLFTRVEFTLMFADVNGTTRCSVESRQDLTFSVLGPQMTRKPFTRVQDIKCFILGRRLTLQSNGFIDVSAAAFGKHLVKCQLYDCKWEFTLDNIRPGQNDLKGPTKKTNLRPWLGFKAIRIIIIVNFVSTVTLGNDLIAPGISYKVEELLKNFQEVLHLRKENENHHYHRKT
ncbi:unnamed protein product [Hydatigera taeniaeformis]|uniref:Calponin-homology (CH) domain-containing protein n=1 Tax=Hydatigena taeniaeformis TaxID=6205 RepID=A0A158RDN4_HYDTA|nr:unnamed protein product [Hydatigera taeniaeformis]